MSKELQPLLELAVAYNIQVTLITGIIDPAARVRFDEESGRRGLVDRLESQLIGLCGLPRLRVVLGATEFEGARSADFIDPLHYDGITAVRFSEWAAESDFCDTR